VKRFIRYYIVYVFLMLFFAMSIRYLTDYAVLYINLPIEQYLTVASFSSYFVIFCALVIHIKQEKIFFQKRPKLCSMKLVTTRYQSGSVITNMVSNMFVQHQRPSVMRC